MNFLENIPENIRMAFEANLDEKYIFDIIALYSCFSLKDERKKYIEYRKSTDSESIYDKVARISKLARTVIKNQGRSFTSLKYSKGNNALLKLVNLERRYKGRDYGKENIFTVLEDTLTAGNRDKITLGRNTDILSYFCFKNYSVGDTFDLIIGGEPIIQITLTGENINDLISPFKEYHPILLISLSYYEVQLKRTNGPTNKVVYSYGLLLNTTLRRKLAQNDHEVRLTETTVFTYRGGMGHIQDE